MRKLLYTLIAVLTGISLVACGDGGLNINGNGPRKSDEGLIIVAATELKDLEPLVQQASDELGFDIALQFPGGTLSNSQALKNDEFDGQVDATWFATNRYVNIIGALDKIAVETSIASSPVAFGVREDKARELGWDQQQPTWAEFADAARDGKFSFGMTDPSSSNSGFSALVSVATALADTGEALTAADIERVGPRLTELFQAQSVISGSSGWLAEDFAENPDRADAIVNYESTLQQMRKDGHPITVVVPADGVISADYPLSTLANPSRENAGEQVKELTEWLLDHQEEIADSFRRPVVEVENLPAELAEQRVIELPFPASINTVEALLDRYNNNYRQRGTTSFILDTSGSMEGERLESLQEIMSSLIDGSAATATGNVALRDNEMVTLQSFSSEPAAPLTAQYNRDDPASKQQFQDYINGLHADGSTAIYDTLYAVLENANPDDGISSIVLLSDGVVTSGKTFAMFKDSYQQLTPAQQSIPVFVILYGEANELEMTDLAELTGGKVFDAINSDLGEVFKEIRGYQ